MASMDAIDTAAVVERTLDAAIALHEQARGSVAEVARAAGAIVSALRAGGKVLIFGNGGSAAEAQHFAAELVGRFVRDRAAMPAIALSSDPSVVTSVANDYGFDRVFARQIDAFGRPGDVAMGISTSGASPNVLAALELARERGLRTIALTGRDGGPVGRAADLHINVPSDATARVQEVQMTLLHAICEIVELGGTAD